jgi:hypothetical protein
MEENVIGPAATRQLSSVPTVSTEPSAYSSRICAMAFCGPNEPVNLVYRPPRHIIHPVAEFDAGGVFARFQIGRDVAVS